MQNLVRSRLEASRKELLDLGLRNPLLNYRYGATRGLEVVGAHSAQVFTQLVDAGKDFTFLAAAPTGSEGASTPHPLKLQSAEPEDKLQQRLLNTYYTARTIMEEQGTNTLFLAMGFLQWFETDQSTEPRLAPLVLVPVTLERGSATEKFRLRYSEADLEPNFSLAAKLKAEFGISLPGLPEEEGSSLDLYFELVALTIQSMSRWTVLPNQVALGFFSFGKFLLYNDLQPEAWPADQRPADHPLIEALLGTGFTDPAPSVGEEAFLDDEPMAGQLLQAVDADATQMLAMLAVHEGRNLVIQGPPGTGKSQTITNIIANAIGQGKKVLFVAEKAAALNVVKNRLDALDLGEACLELHSQKANKKELHTELRRTLELGKPALQHLQQQVALLEQHRQELNAYSKAVNAEIQASGLSAHDVMGRLIQLGAEIGQQALPALKFADIQSWDAVRMQRAEALAIRIAAGLQDNRPPDTYLFWGSGLQVLLPSRHAELIQLLDATASAAIAISKGAAAIARQAGMPIPAHRKQVMQLTEALQVAAGRPQLTGINMATIGWNDRLLELEALVENGQRLSEMEQQYAEKLLPEAWDATLMPIRTAIVAHGHKWYRFLFGEYKQAVQQLAAYSRQPLPADYEARLQLVDDILEVQRLKKTLKSQEGLAQTFFGTAWLGTASNWEQLKAATRFLSGVQEQIRTGKLDASFITYLEANEDRRLAADASQQLLSLLNEHGKQVQALTEMIQFNDGVRFPGATLLHQPFLVQVPLLQQWCEKPEALHEVIAFNNLVQLAGEEALLPLVQLAAHWPGAKELLLAVLQKTWYQHLLETAFHTMEPLRRFERSAHESVAAQFRQLDLRNLQFNRAQAALTHWEGLPPADAGGQMNLLRNEFNKKARHLPIRRLMEEAGAAIQAIKPVFMMSPLSIAHFLPPGAVDFDLVIFDEASQVRPVEALGAMLRGRQVVVVGDSQQLPPTAFFDSLTPGAENLESLTADLPSILSLCDAQGAPQRMLRWHYRSRHESLIRLSNQEFYDNKLVLFPAPGSRQGAGLFFHHLPHTAYDRGGSRTNVQEAEAVVLAVLEHTRKHPHQTLGVVAFSTAQRDAIQNRLEQARKQMPELEAWFARHPQEPFFVKNLENVQGDERDVIFISVGYGRIAKGYVSQSFGPLNMEGGEKRLNVLITRSRLRCEVFTNLTADDIDAGRSASRGVAVLKRFLQFAQHGTIEVPLESGRASGSPFEEAVVKRLTGMGYQVHQQVGAAGFFIDLAILDPEQPGRYVLGIECDGASYHSARTARDRDRLRQQVLEAMGWKLHRIWSTEWFRNQEKELERLVVAINTAWKASLDASEESDEVVTDTSVLREEPKAISSQLEPYQLVQLPAEISQLEMHQHPIGKMAKWVELVVRVEGPIHFDELARRMVEAAGITRVGPRIREHLKLATRFAEGSGAIRQNDSFLYLSGAGQAPMRDRSNLPPASRKWKYIAPEEIGSVLFKVVKDAVVIAPDEAYPIVVKLFGFARVTEEMRNDILQLIKPMKSSGLLKQSEAGLEAAI
ncbi:Protein of unknown function [Cnuella takakiae]|uniref:RAP domain-containing protein n=1 Tax=Cnuella takakiae TaxID=1302690 RepID=A0A1M4XZM8_9BACT|nr:DUF3320 domain-containing protein [Cnuella takakiae]OLY92998.1 DNA helicase [Cnuella takakiae]SHE98888.1 Protein of unknown function [Cnuella takakiae]